jgi:hypothetical protein
MNDAAPLPTPPVVDSTFDSTRPLFAGGPPDPVVYDGSPRAIRQRTVNFAAKRFADMMYVSGLDRGTAQRHFRWRPLGMPGGLSARPDVSDGQAELVAAHRAGRLTIETNDADRRATVRWSDPTFGAPLNGAAIARPGYGGILLGSRDAPSFDPVPIARAAADPGCTWPRGDAVEMPAPPPTELATALDALFAGSPGIYGILIASPERVLTERYSAFGAPERDAKLVDDQGGHLHVDRPADPRGLARLGVRSGTRAALARSALDPSPDHARPSAAHALGTRLSGGR